MFEFYLYENEDLLKETKNYSIDNDYDILLQDFDITKMFSINVLVNLKKLTYFSDGSNK